MQLTVKAPAKINLALDILGTRSDGFHNISTVLQTVSLFDTITVAEGGSDKIRIFCDNPRVPLDSSNLVYKAASAYFEQTKRFCPIDITIEKHIPIAAGLAGGSADAAAVLVGLDRLLGGNADIMKIGGQIGSDVPFCIKGGTALAKEGTGTLFEPAAALCDCFIVIAKPQVDISAGYAYGLFDRKSGRAENKTHSVLWALEQRDLTEIGKSIFNCFEQVIQLEDIDSIKAIMLGCGSKGCIMSGSGSSVFGLFGSEKGAENAYSELKRRYDEVFIARPYASGSTII